MPEPTARANSRPTESFYSRHKVSLSTSTKAAEKSRFQLERQPDGCYAEPLSSFLALFLLPDFLLPLWTRLYRRARPVRHGIRLDRARGGMPRGRQFGISFVRHGVFLLLAGRIQPILGHLQDRERTQDFTSSEGCRTPMSSFSSCAVAKSRVEKLWGR